MSNSSADSNETRSPIIASWILLIATCVLAVIPFIGFLAWVIGGVTILIAIVLAIVVISKGGTWPGIFILVAAMVVVPLIVLFGPIISSMVAGVAIDQANPDSKPSIEMTTEAAETAAEANSENEKAASETEVEAGDAAVESVNDAAETAAEAPLKE